MCSKYRVDSTTIHYGVGSLGMVVEQMLLVSLQFITN